MTGVAPAPTREAGSLPFPGQPRGTANPDMPFDHIIVVMMENHSFDNLLGGLPLSNPDVEGLTFDAAGNAVNSNPGTNHMPAEVKAFPLPNTAQAKNVSQTWKATHEQIAGGQMNGFVRSAGALEPMGYYTTGVLPFAYSLASNFTLGNRWFSSAPAPTYPNRRFLLAGTAYGCTTTSAGTLLDPPPPHGTIFDRLSEAHVNWCDYFTDVPMTAVIPSIVLKHADHHASIDKFFHDCQAGTLPAVSFVDPGLGVADTAITALPLPVKTILEFLGANFQSTSPGQTEEDPQNMYYGEAWAHRVVEAVLQSPRWNRTLLVYIYDEHGGYYDHVPPPAAIPPDNIAPVLQPGDPPGGYDMYGPRVPAIVVSPYSKPGGVANKIHDHTSVLATIEEKWNLPALTRRDANANTVMDFLDPANAALLNPPVIDAPPKPPGL
ncbi:MAG: alkaline phosphatase family protein [Solirubrobacteraceae bacterium]